MLIAIAVLSLLLIWAGYGVFQLVGPKTIQSDIPAGVFILILSGVLGLGWIALVTAELGLFSSYALAIAGALLGGVGWVVARRRGTRLVLSWSDTRRNEVLFLALLILLMAVLYLRPHEFIFGGADAGVYINLGANISRTGRWQISSVDLANIPQTDYEMLFRKHPPHLIPRYYHLPAFYISDNLPGTIIPQYYPLHPIWLAVAHGLGGVWASLFMPPLWGMLGVLALYFALKEAYDPHLAALAAFILAITPTQIWFSRYPTAETLTLFLLFGGFYGFARHVRRQENWAAVLSGFALGQVLLTRIDALPLLCILPVYAAYLRMKNRYDHRFWAFAMPLLVMALHSTVHAVCLGWPYLYNTYLNDPSPIPFKLTITIGGLTLASMASIVLDRVIARFSGIRARLDTIWRVTLSVASIALILLAAYAYFLRPLQADPSAERPYWYGEGTIPDVEPYNMVRLGWYLSPLGLVLGVAGLALIIREQFNERTWILASVGIVFSAMFLYRTFSNPHHVYVMRRYVPAVIPTFVIGATYALLRLAKWQQAGLALAIVLLVACVGWMLLPNWAMVHQVDRHGVVSQYRTLSAQIPPDAIVLFNDDQPVGTAGVFGTPLAYLDGRTVLDLQEDHLSLDRLDILVQGWMAKGRPVVVVNGSSPVSGLCDRWDCRSLGTTQISFTVLEASYKHRPTAIIPIRYSLEPFVVESVQR